MSRTSFNIRKLIGTWPEGDEDKDAFECSSARSIRKQYELEQYQTQQIQKVHAEHRHRSWRASGSPSKPKVARNAPKLIAVDGNTNLSKANSSRRISSPMLRSPLSGRTTPLSERSSEESLLAIDETNYPHAHQQHLVVPGKSSTFPGASGHRFSRLSPDGPSSAPSSREASPVHGDLTRFPGSSSQARGQIVSSARHPAPTMPNIRPYEVAETPSIIMTPAGAATNRPNRSSFVMDGRVQQSSAFINGQPSPPLEPDEFLQDVIDSRDPFREMPSVSTLALDGEDAWAREDGELSDVSDNVQQLIWETDEAFKAVSSALADARMTSRSPDLPGGGRSSPLPKHTSHDSHEQLDVEKRDPTPNIKIETPPSQPQAGAGHDAGASLRRASEPSISPRVVIENQGKPLNASSIAKSKKPSKSPRAKVMQAMSHESSPAKQLQARATGAYRPHHTYHRSMSKLNLAADKVTDKIFEGRANRFGFLKVEADEVVTPEQVEQFRQNRLAKQSAKALARKQASTETLGSVSDIVGDESSSASDADVEPFHLQDLPSRIGHSGVNVLSPVPEVASPVPSDINNKGVMGQLPKIAGNKTPTTATKDVRIGQESLATPPPTPPQHPINTATNSTLASQAANAEDDDSMHLRNLGLSKLPNRRLAHQRSASSTSHTSSLPTIPEVKFAAPPAWDASRLTQQKERRSPAKDSSPQTTTPLDANGNPYFEEDEEHIFLQSTPISATMPSFQHGRISLAKADLVNAGTINSVESKLLTSPEETLDWTAFQMAILGGAGDLFNDPDNFLSPDAQEEMVDDLCDWAEDLGFSNADLGALVRTKPRRATSSRQPRTPVTAAMSTPSSNKSFHDPSHRRKHSAASTSSSLGSGLTRSGDSPDHSFPIAVENEHSSGFWHHPSSSHRSGSDVSAASASSRYYGGPGLKRWTLEGHPKRYHGMNIDVHKANVLPLGGAGKALPRTPGSAAMGGKGIGRASIDSLPQSPMLELRMMTGVDGSREFVSMGYNLNHDLGDFLKWESEHAYASGFYGAD